MLLVSYWINFKNRKIDGKLDNSNALKYFINLLGLKIVLRLCRRTFLFLGNIKWKVKTTT